MQKSYVKMEEELLSEDGTLEETPKTPNKEVVLRSERIIDDKEIVEANKRALIKLTAEEQHQYGKKIISNTV